MARSGSGDYTAPSNTVNPAATGTTIDPTDFNELVDDVESALSESHFTAATSGTDNAVIRNDGTGGRKLQASAVTIDDSGNLAGVGTVNTKALPTGDFVGTSDTQTLTNKTLTAPVINVGSDAQGDVYFRNSSGVFSRLAPGTPGYVLTSGGAGADPSWTAAGSGDVSASSAFGTDNVLVRSDGTGKGVQATGISVADTTNNVTGIGDLTISGALGGVTNVTGADTDFVTGTPGSDGNLAIWNADGDIVNGPASPSGDVVGTSDTQTLSNKTLSAPVINVGSDAHGDIYYRNSSGIFTRLAPGTSGQFLRTNGAAADPSWVTIPGGGDMLSSNNLSDVASAATAFANIKQAATDTATGVVELATTAEATTGTDTSRAITAAGLKAHVDARLRTKQIFTSSGTYTKPAGLRLAKITVVGGGGAGRGTVSITTGQAACGGGGGAGGVAIAWVDGGDIGSSETVTIGAGGAGAAGVGTANAGSPSSMTITGGSTISATGGVAGSGIATASSALTPAVGGAAGVGSNGDMNFGGDAGTEGIRLSGSDAYSGTGGGGPFGSGGVGVRTFGSSSAGNNANGYGAGGGGATAANVTVGELAGGSGSAGIVIVEEFY